MSRDRTIRAIGIAPAQEAPPDNDGSSWDCVDCGTNVTGPSVALPCPKCGGRMERARVGALLIEAQAWVERMESTLCDPRAGHGDDAKCAGLHAAARHIKGLFATIAQRAAPRAVEGAAEPEPIVNEDVLRRLLRRADVRIAELEAALAPFAGCANKLDAESKYPDEYNDNESCAFTVQPTLRAKFKDFTVGDLRRAAAALSRREPQ